MVRESDCKPRTKTHNKRIEFAHGVRPTPKVLRTLLAAHSRRWASEKN